VIGHTASATRYLTLTGSNGGNPTISTSAGDLAITPRVILAGGLETNIAPATAWSTSVGTAQAITIADDAVYTLPAGSGEITVMDNSTGSYVKFASHGGSTSLMHNPNSIGATADTDTFLCCYYNGSTAYVIKNRLGTSRIFFIRTDRIREST
jgi:hypothetical protein